MASEDACEINASDQEKIRAVVMGFFEAWNHDDMKAFAELFTDEADWGALLPGLLGAGENAHRLKG